MQQPSQQHRSASTAERKAQVRANLRKERIKRSAHKNENALKFLQQLTQIISWQSQKNLTIAAYLPSGTEPPITLALEKLQRAGQQILVPIVEKNHSLSWSFWEPDMECVTNSFGLQEPVATRYDHTAFFEADLRLIPALAFDRQGWRLGQGGGYYDRLLAAVDLSKEKSLPLAARKNFGLVFAAEILDEVPHDSWDVQIHTLLTEEGIQTSSYNSKGPQAHQ